MEGVGEMGSEKGKVLGGYDLEESKEQCEEKRAHRRGQERNVHIVQRDFVYSRCWPIETAEPGSSSFAGLKILS